MKPKFLYHGSQYKDLVVIEPRKISYRKKSDKERIYATPYITFASCFIVPINDSWTNISSFSKAKNDIGTQIVIISDKQRFLNLDKGGAIYKIKSDGFVPIEQGSAGLIKKEWFSEKPAEVISKITYASGLKAMLSHGVKVYFIDKDTFRKITRAKDHGLSIINSLSPYCE